MSIGDDLREFLTTRRARLTPADVGLPDFGGRRRVPGLRREEVAMVAGVSVEYYVRLERGTAKGISDSVLDGVARALQLDDAERAHLFELMRGLREGAHPISRRPRPRPQQIRAGVQQLLDAMTGVPAIVQNGRLDILGSNRIARALFSTVLEQPDSNFARFVFLDPSALDYYRDWPDVARQTTAILRVEAGRVPNDRALTDLVGELATRSEEFRTLWASHDVRDHRAGLKLVTHPVVGDLDLAYESMDLTNDRGLTLTAYSAAPGSRSEESLRMLDSWATEIAPLDPQPSAGLH